MAAVFISYSRKDKEFVRKLGEALTACEREAWVDWKDIPLTAEWQKQILTNIEAADNFVFVISPDSIASSNCENEINHAAANNKRMVPIFYRYVADVAIPASLGKFQRIDFGDGDDFDEKFKELVEALDTDLLWTQAHTRLLTRAKEWEREGKDNSFLLRGKDLREAESWVARGAEQKPKATTLQSQYILASRQAAAKIQRIIIGAVAIAFVAALGLAIYAFLQRNRAQQQTKLAQQRQVQAESATREATEQRNLAQKNATEAQNQTKEATNQRNAAILEQRIASSGRLATTALLQDREGNFDLAALLSVEAFNTEDTFEARNALLSTIQTNSRLRAYLHHPDSVSSVAFSPDGRHLATATGAALVLWNIESGRPLYGPTRCTSCKCKPCSLDVADSVDRITFSPDGSKLALAGGAIVQLWDVAGWHPLGEPLVGHNDIIDSVSFSPDGKLLASGSADGTIRLWNVISRKPFGEPLHGHTSFVYDVAFSPDGKTLVSSGADDRLRVWDIVTRQPLSNPINAHKVYHMALSPDGKVLASSDQQGGLIRLWDVSSGQALGEPLKGHTQSVTDLAFSPSGKILATASQDNSIRLWDVMNRQILLVLQGHKMRTSGVAFSPDGKLLASAGADRKVDLWEFANPVPLGKLLYRLSPGIKREILGGSITEGGSNDLLLARSTGVAFSPRGKLFASGGPDNSLQLWSTETWKRIGQPLTGHTKEIDGLTISPDGKRLASGSYDQTIRFWNVASHQPLGKPLQVHTGPMFGLAFSPAGDLLASASGDASIRLFDVVNRRPIGALKGHTEAVWSVAFSPDGQTLASASVDTTVKLWNVASRKLVGELAGHGGAVYSVAFSPDGEKLASGGHDHLVRLWDLASQRMLGEPFQGHSGIVQSVTFSPDSKTLASASTDKTIRLWDVESQREIGEPFYGHPDRVEHLAFSPDGKTLASAGGEDTVVLWDLNVQSWVEKLCLPFDKSSFRGTTNCFKSSCLRFAKSELNSRMLP